MRRATVDTTLRSAGACGHHRQGTIRIWRV